MRRNAIHAFDGHPAGTENLPGGARAAASRSPRSPVAGADTRTSPARVSTRAHCRPQRTAPRQCASREIALRPRNLRTRRAPHAAIAALARATDSLGLTAFARQPGDAPALVVRAFPCGVGIDEDPASGAANGLIASWLRELEPNGPLSRGYTVSQGREIGHDARLDVAIDADGTVWVGGRSHVVVDGRLAWPYVT